MLKRAGVALVLIILWTSGSQRALCMAGGGVRSHPQMIRAASCGPPPLSSTLPIEPTTALILIEKDAVGAEYYSAHAEAINAHTVFATASLGKWIAAHAVMKLVEQGKLDLDQPVEAPDQPGHP